MTKARSPWEVLSKETGAKSEHLQGYLERTKYHWYRLKAHPTFHYIFVGNNLISKSRLDRLQHISHEPVSRIGTSNARTQVIKIERLKRMRALGGQRGGAMRRVYWHLFPFQVLAQVRSRSLCNSSSSCSATTRTSSTASPGNLPIRTTMSRSRRPQEVPDSGKAHLTPTRTPISLNGKVTSIPLFAILSRSWRKLRMHTCPTWSRQRCEISYISWGMDEANCLFVDQSSNILHL